MAELVDAPDLGSGGSHHEGSSPSIRTIYELTLIYQGFLFYSTKNGTIHYASQSTHS